MGRHASADDAPLPTRRRRSPELLVWAALAAVSAGIAAWLIGWSVPLAALGAGVVFLCFLSVWLLTPGTTTSPPAVEQAIPQDPEAQGNGDGAHSGRVSA